MSNETDIKLGGQLSLEELWMESSGDVNSSTFRDLASLAKKIDSSERKKRTLWVIVSVLFAAALMAGMAQFTFSLIRNRYTVSPLEDTRSLVANYGETSFITLEDGTVVHLNSGSCLLYPKAFDKNNRIVFLTGEGNFSVAKDPSRPFIVKTAHMDVEALGTTFCVQAYPEERAVRTTLEEGKVQVDIPSAGEKSYLLDPGQQLVYYPLEQRVSVDRVDARKVMGWEDGYLSFVDASFPEIASVLERRFDVSVNFNTENMKQNAINVRFVPGETLEDMLDVLKLLIPGSRYTRNGERIYWYF